MIRQLLWAVMALGSQYATLVRAEDNALHTRPVNAHVNDNSAPAAVEARGAVDLLQLQGDPTAIRLEVRQSSVTKVLAALATTYPISYRSAVTLDDLRDGTYQGPLRQVIAQLLEGYDYVIEVNGATLDILVLSKSGEWAVSAPTMPAIRQHRIPVTARISRH
jgi:hypothetical protein